MYLFIKPNVFFTNTEELLDFLNNLKNYTISKLERQFNSFG